MVNDKLSRADLLQIYNEVRNKIRNGFPRNFWKGEMELERAKILTRYFIEEILNWSQEDVRNHLSQRTFYENGSRALLRPFNDSVFRAIENAYPGKFKKWEFRQNRMWKGHAGLKLAAEATRWLIEEKLKWPPEDVREKLCCDTFIINGFSGMLMECLNGSPYKAIENAYPGRYKEWEFSQNRMWKGKTGLELARKATKWLIEEKLKWSDGEIKAKLSQEVFKANGLRGMLAICFENSPYKAIENAYPGRFKPWEFTQLGMWQGEKGLELAREATKWLIEEILGWSDEEIKNKLTLDTFKEHGLGGMVSRCFNNSVIHAIENAYLGRFKPWDFRWNGMWQGDEGLKLAKQAIKWLIEGKLRGSKKDIKEKLSGKIFTENGLSGMLTQCFHGSSAEAINYAYPNEFKKWDFSQMGIWQGEEGKKLAEEATKWLIEEKLKWDEQDIKDKLSQKVFLENGLGSVLHVFNGSPYKAIENAYPRRFKPWEFTQNSMWSGKEGLELAKRAIRWLIEEKLKWGDEEIKLQLSQKTFSENGFSGLLNIFHGSPYQAIESTYPGRFKPWDFRQLGIWQGEEGLKLAKEATGWMIEEKLGWTDNEIKEKLTGQVFAENGLGGMLSQCFNQSTYKAIENAYPSRFKKVDFPQQGMWQGEEGLELAIQEVKWLIEERLKWSDEEIKGKLSQETFKENGLNGVLRYFNSSPYQAMESAYPCRFKKWEFTQRGMWEGEGGLKLAKEATRWLIEKKLKWSDEEVRDKLMQETFKQNGLNGMMSSAFYNSPYKAIENAYPGKFKEWEFTQNRMWKGEKGLNLAISAVKWLFEEKLKWSEEEIKEKLTRKTFKEHKL